MIKGKVQGVFYRVSAKKEANRVGVKGWVRNTKDGDVEMMITGTNDQILHFIEWCKNGPPGAKVEKLVSTAIPEQDFDGFRILH